MAENVLPTHIDFTGVVGVGQIELNLQLKQSVYCFIGENGVGKTKFLEALFQTYFLRNRIARQTWPGSGFLLKNLLFREAHIGELVINLAHKKAEAGMWGHEFSDISATDSQPVLFLGALHRGQVSESNKTIESVKAIGSLEARQKTYIGAIIGAMNDDFSSMSMQTNMSEWFVVRAQSANPYQKQEDNRRVEIDTVLQLLHEVDKRIDPNFLEIGGDYSVFLKIFDEKRELKQLSSGFSSILKLIQSIVAGYSYFTNEVQIQSVRGVVLIDEIESHLHSSWQAKIIPLLKRLFPNTTFVVTTHSPIVLTQLKHGEAYRLVRDESDGVVRSHLIDYPNRSAFVDLLNDAFDVDLNDLKLGQNLSPDEIKQSKSKLLNLLNRSVQEDAP